MPTSRVPILDGDEKIPEKFLPERLADSGLADVYASRPNAQRDRGFGDPQHEDGIRYTYPNRIDFGPVEPPPPVVGGPGNRGIDLIAHWYNDFGLELEASSPTQANGAYTWYDWRWNFPSNTGDGTTANGYDPQRHPLQGFYQGDDPDVLGWQCKWMAEAGLSAVSLVASNGVNTSTWSNPADSYYWMYQLFNNVETFKSLRWLMWLRHGSNADYNAAAVPGDGTHPLEVQWAQMVAIYAAHDGGYTYTENGKTYAVVFQWDGELVRGAWDNYVGATKTTQAYVWLANQFRAIGYDGVMVVARNATGGGTMNRASLLNSNVIYVTGYYATTGTSGAFTDFEDYATLATFPTAFDAVPSVVTSYKTTYPHPSGQNLPGTTPALFGLALRRAVDSVIRQRQRRLLFINNVSEWAESGPGLLPTVADGFGYLDQIRSLPPAPESRTSVSDGLYERVVASGGATTSLTVNVPAWANRLELRFSGTSNIAQSVLMRINGDGGANYDNQTLTVSGATVTGAEAMGATSANVGSISDSSGRNSRTVVDLSNGATNIFRSWISSSFRYKGPTAGNNIRCSNAGGWRSSASITSLTILIASGTLLDGATLEVYAHR